MSAEHPLIDKYLDEELSPAEQRAPSEWLLLDPQHVRQFVRATHLHRDLRQCMLARPFQAEARAIVERRASSPSRVGSTGLLPRPTRLSELRPWALRLLVPVSLILMGAIGLWYLRPSAEARLVQFQGAGVLLERDRRPVTAAPGMVLRPGDQLHTPTNGMAAIGFAREATRIDLRAGSDLTISSLARGKRLTLGTGQLDASVDKQHWFSPMVFTTSQAEARVLGTQLRLIASADRTELEVSAGQVRFTRQGLKPVKVSAGEYTIAGTNVELAPLPLTGDVLHEYWTNSPARVKRKIAWEGPLSGPPDHVETLSELAVPPHPGDYFGQRIRGYIHPPKTGAYTFWIAGNDWSEFRLSRDDKAFNKVSLAKASDTDVQEWTKDTRQQQTWPLILRAGRMYYFEVVQDFEKSEHHFSVAWQGPERDREIIPGKFISPFTSQQKSSGK